jgi:hypothetical protein
MGIGFNAADYEKVESTWDQEDQRLLNLQGLPAFKGYKKWSQCRSEHYRVLIQQTMLMLPNPTDAERADADHPVTSTLNFFLLCLVRCLEASCQATIELLHVNRVSSTDIGFDFTAVMDMKFSQPPPLEEDDDTPFTHRCGQHEEMIEVATNLHEFEFLLEGWLRSRPNYDDDAQMQYSAGYQAGLRAALLAAKGEIIFDGPDFDEGLDQEVSGSPDIDIDFADRTAAMAALFTVARNDRPRRQEAGPSLRRLLPRRAGRSLHAPVCT